MSLKNINWDAEGEKKTIDRSGDGKGPEIVN